MKMKTATMKKSEPRTRFAEEYAKGICAADTSEAIYKVIESDDVSANSVTKKSRRSRGENVRARRD
jgi:hypothetical protein